MRKALKGLDREIKIFNKVNTNWTFADYCERPLLGLFNNALIRNANEKVYSFMLYEVYNKKEKHIGQADFLFGTDKFDILLEAKHIGKENPKWNYILSKAYEQAKRYYTPENSYFIKETKYLAAMQFSYCDASDVTEYTKQEFKKDELDFYCEYKVVSHRRISWMLCYGRINKI